MTLGEIYEKFSAGSPGFCTAVSTHCGFATSDDETRRIAEKASTSAEFERIWQSEDWWTDANNE